MTEYYSKTGSLLHIVRRLGDVMEQNYFRKDIIGPDEYLQCSSLKMDKGHTFRPHKHICKNIPSWARAQESWVVITGSVMCIFYDLDDTVLAEVVLNPGDASFTLMGGHTYEALENGTIVYEYKTGPYTGQESDKVFI
jgi:cupin fold WbuC family metalloprotein